MVTFETTPKGIAIKVNNQTIGYFTERGFYMDSGTVRDYMRPTAADMREVGDKIEELENARAIISEVQPT
jgi:hypothetical protein